MEWRASVWDMDGGAGAGSASGHGARRLSSDWFVNKLSGGTCAHMDITDLVSGRALALTAPSTLFELRVEGWTTGAPHATATVRGSAKFALEWDEEAQAMSATNLPGMDALQFSATLSAGTVANLERAAKEVAGQVERLQARMDKGLGEAETGRGRGNSTLKTNSAYGTPNTDGEGEVHRFTTSKVGRQR